MELSIRSTIPEINQFEKGKPSSCQKGRMKYFHNVSEIPTLLQYI